PPAPRPRPRRQPPPPAAAPHPAHGNPYSPDRLAAAGIKVGRNDACPCGSGKRYKQCHGRLA
ncbi:SEC-C metal-binding domain-containing protein, partial [Microvirgula aerodenitrificans]|uniref:SEC-C metal-binding domain-containing protein n=1 Tax=Microvirgula aerodenitrificans TaxID=57480 RepID=UPI00248DB0FC